MDVDSGGIGERAHSKNENGIRATHFRVALGADDIEANGPPIPTSGICIQSWNEPRFRRRINWGRFRATNWVKVERLLGRSTRLLRRAAAGPSLQENSAGPARL